jgi:phosphate butyryltransferase
MNLPEMQIPEIRSWEQLVGRAREKTNGNKRLRAALVTPNEPDMLRACDKAAKKGLIDPIVIGDLSAYEKVCAETGVRLAVSKEIDVSTPTKAVKAAAEMAARGEIDIIIKGRIMTGDMLRELFHDSLFLVKGKMVSHVAVLRPERYKKLLMITDCAVVTEQDIQTKLSLIGNIIRVSKYIGISNPRIAILAAVEVVYPTMPVTTDAAIISKMAERGQIKDAYVDGPLSFDVAVDMFAAHSKGVKTSQVAGQADAMLAPNIETANGIYKAMALYGHCEMGGVIVGGKVPIALGSRSDTEQGKFNSIVLGVLAG